LNRTTKLQKEKKREKRETKDLSKIIFVILLNRTTKLQKGDKGGVALATPIVGVVSFSSLYFSL